MIKLHGIAGSRSFRTLWLLHEMGLECDYQEYAIMDGSLRTPEFRAISPASRVPALEIDGRVLFESGAICEYLCETRPEHGLAPAVGADARSSYLEWLHFSETQANLIANLNMQHLFLPDPAMRSPTVMSIDTRRLALTLKALEQALEGKDYLLGAFSAADTMSGFNLLAAERYVRFDKFANVAAYLVRISARAAFQSAQAVEGPQQFYKKDFYELPSG